MVGVTNLVSAIFSCMSKVNEKQTHVKYVIAYYNTYHSGACYKAWGNQKLKRCQNTYKKRSVLKMTQKSIKTIRPVVKIDDDSNPVFWQEIDTFFDEKGSIKSKKTWHIWSLNWRIKKVPKELHNEIRNKVQWNTKGERGARSGSIYLNGYIYFGTYSSVVVLNKTR